VNEESSSPAPAPEEATAPITNRLEVPAAVRQNLGMTFAKAEERFVGKTLRLAGDFELTPSARQPFHAGLSGIVTLYVRPLDHVETGQLLASVTSPELIERRHELHVSSDAVGAANDTLAVANAKLQAARANMAALAKRNKRRGTAGARSAELETREATHRRVSRIMKVERDALARQVVRSEHRFEAELLSFALLLGVEVDDLETPHQSEGDHGTQKPRWEVVARLEVRALSDGVIGRSMATSGAWVTQGAKLLEVHDRTRLQLRAAVQHADIDKLTWGQSVAVVPPDHNRLTNPEPVMGNLRIATVGDPLAGMTTVLVSLDSVPGWVRAGTAGFAEAVVGGGGSKEVAIPVAALVRDGLQDIFFRRDPKDPDKVIRVEAERGVDDGRWVVIFSGLIAGDEVVVNGASELKLASSKKPSTTGHFHADGTFHKGDH
jgi:multidrug efflux pump subunit AcrA (membrane-fusion protein)